MIDINFNAVIVLIAEVKCLGDHNHRLNVMYCWTDNFVFCNVVLSQKLALEEQKPIQQEYDYITYMENKVSRQFLGSIIIIPTGAPHQLVLELVNKVIERQNNHSRPRDHNFPRHHRGR